MSSQIRYESAQRYYLVRCARNLFGELVLSRSGVAWVAGVAASGMPSWPMLTRWPRRSPRLPGAGSSMLISRSNHEICQYNARTSKKQVG